MCADLLGGAFHRREFLDLRELNNLLEASAGAVGNLDVAAGALDDLARDGEPKAGARDILPPAWIDAEERLEHLAEKLRRNARPFVLDEHPRLGFAPLDPDVSAPPVGRGIDHEIAQRAGKPEPVRPHADRLRLGDGHVQP